MAEPRHVLAIDQGTTSTRSIVFDAAGREVASARREFPQHYPDHGWVEHDPEDIWRDTLATAREALEKAALPVAAIGITNQRETVVVWDRANGQPIHRAIVWQDRRTAAECARLRQDGAEPLVQARTGLLLDPYFSATKLAWILDNVAGARARAERGELAFGTIDSFLLWRLTGGKVHATDATNASRTLLFDIHRQCWDEELLALFRIPAALLPVVHDNSHLFGETDPAHFGTAIPIAGMAGDQQAALFGQVCCEPGMVKATYGTGCFALMNTGSTPPRSQHRLLATTAYRLDGKATYAAEGAIFVAGAAIKWLRDGLGLITHASQTDDMATRIPDSHGVYMVPGFVGLGAPHWDPKARGLICGLTLDATAAHIARAALESVAYQTWDLAEAMRKDGAGKPQALRVDGGMAANDWFCQFLADMLEVPVERPSVLETTALGAAFLAGLQTGVWPGIAALAGNWSLGRRFLPRMDASQRQRMIAGWQDALRRALSQPD
ncbi:glycerol kinase [Pseudoroseomonas wenyumeiae]|uniref:Glycerol kinase n=1 Tax=Teichococcus wenyumeiae TaxID=2478470 RepID=A0A3A9JDK9_9PROT|nr:glycerol kinase GlpK [Pseudoroseomonas wenyumeiae]RKK02773.1 glycerol kinase [Pseudoroseomonas wenyumeiae]RMI15437.1 glycerol kinase [Pseudoroseomonas wenyumeiae]